MGIVKICFYCETTRKKILRFYTMWDQLKAIWNLVRGIKVVDVGHGFCMVKFDLTHNLEKCHLGRGVCG